MIGKDICRKIRELRKSMKLTQSQFAELVDLSEDSIGKIERCVTIPTIETLHKIAGGVKMPIEALISSPVERSDKRSSKMLTDLISYLKTRPPEDIKLIHEIAIKIFESKTKKQKIL